MNFLEFVRARYSVRSFRPEPVKQEDLDAILAAGLAAPTACNYQPQKIFVAQKQEHLEALASVCRCTFGAPTILVIGYDTERDWKNKFTPGYSSGETDAAIVCTHMMLAAWEKGVGSCWVGYFKDTDISRVLGLPETVRVTALLPMGYPSEDAAPLPLHSQSRDLSDTVTYL